MGNLELLATAIAYMEEHMQEDIRTEDVANACYCSKSTIEKLFRNVNNISVRDYLMRRRMTKAAKTIVEHQELSILDVALMYGYSSNEAFTRAFLQIWNCSPSKFRENAYTWELFPRLNVPMENGEVDMELRRKYDISELYDLFKSRMGNYFICCDIRSLVPINEISIKAGDIAIIESMRRMDEAAGPEDVVFRIGGDEFAMLTNSDDEAYAQSIVDKILSHNGEPIVYEGQEIPLKLYAGPVKWQGKVLRYNDLFTQLISALRELKPEKYGKE